MRAPFCPDTSDSCSEEKGIYDSDENASDILSFERSLEKNRCHKGAVFGVCLEDLMGTSTHVVPRIPFIVSRLCRYIETHGIHCKGLFIEGDEKSIVENLKIEFVEFGDASLEKTNSVASAAKLLVIFLEQLPQPLVPVSSQADFIQGMESLTLNSPDCIACLKLHVEELSDNVYQMLKYLAGFLVKLAKHKEQNGMSLDSLALIFGPAVFRPVSNNASNVGQLINIMGCFLHDYQQIFEDATPVVSHKSSQQLCSSKRVLNRPLTPLTLVIPSEETDSPDNESKINVPVLLIEGQADFKCIEKSEVGAEFKVPREVIGALLTRKRKERRFSGEEQPRSSSEERPSNKSLMTVQKFDALRRCNSHEEGIDEKPGSSPMDVFVYHKEEEGQKSDSLMDLISEKNSSPHPPDAKRREVDTKSPKNSYETTFPFHYSKFTKSMDETTLSDLQQNLIVKPGDTTPMLYEDLGEAEVFSGNSSSSSSSSSCSSRGGIQRSASYPIPKHNAEESSESGSSSLSMSWSMLFEDSEPIRSEHPLNLQVGKDSHEDGAMLSPSIQKLRSADFYEAPLSPSAFRSYLSYRSSHLDSSVPPSPPVEQEDFAKKLGDSSAVVESIRQLSKKIHCIKKRIRKFEEKFEVEHGYKPSHVEKSNHREGKKLLHDLNKARREIKVLKEEAHLEHASLLWHVDRGSHVLEDSTNRDRSSGKPTVEDSLGQTMQTLVDDRKSANRPECVEDMSTDQVKEEKVALQKALLHFESVHGKPLSRDERSVARPLYDRYRSVKRLLVRSGSFPGAAGKELACNELQPILEHETMDFPSREQRVAGDETSEATQPEISKPDIEDSGRSPDDQSAKSINNFMTKKYDNSNLHELSLSEQILQSQINKSEKRRLRKVLRDFETEFLRLNGRKAEKEDKSSMEIVYSQYKHVKARLRLLEALISKHEQHQLM